MINFTLYLQKKMFRTFHKFPAHFQLCLTLPLMLKVRIYNLLTNLDINKAPGPDEIPLRIFEVAPIL